MRLLSISLLLVLFAGCSSSQKEYKSINTKTFDPSYSSLATALSTYIHGERVDYAGLKQNRNSLDDFIGQLAGLTQDQYQAMNRSEQMAMWINAYNGITLRSIIDAYPVASIKDIDGVWKKKKWPVAGREVTLDEIEHSILRPEFKDARVHFAVNCASIGCPPLALQPFIPASLDEQLNKAARTFVNNPARNKYDAKNHVITTSEIFDWFGDDFTKQYAPDDKMAGLENPQAAVFNFIMTFADDSLKAELDPNQKWTLKYTPYDWSLNDIERQ